jgi:two-component system cell cycle response regulator
MKNKKILIIEDNEAVTRSLQYTLTEEGFEVAIANAGIDGIAAAAKGDVDLILLDLIIPGYSGFEVIEKIKDNPDSSDIPVIVFSNLDRPEDVKLLKEMGAVDFLSKSEMDGKKIAAKLTQFFA